MKGLQKRLAAMVLLAAVLFGLAPHGGQVYAADAAQALSDGDYDTANQVMEQTYAIAAEAGGNDFSLSQDTVQAIKAYLTQCADVEPDSIQVQGSNIQWRMHSGITCAYSPALLEQAAQDTGAAEQSMPGDQSGTADTEVIPYGASDTAHGSDIYLFEPYYGLSDDFTDHYQTEAKALAAQTGGTYHYYKGGAATVENIADALEKGGVIIFNSHGTTDYAGSGSDYTSGATTSYLCLQSGTGLTAEDYQEGHAVYGGVIDGLPYYQVDGTVLVNHMERQGSGGLVWMAICLGMATDGLAQPLLEQGEGVVYGYSQSVTFKGDACFSDDFFDSLMDGSTMAEAIADMKASCGEWDYSPKLCAKAGLSSFYMVSTKEDAQKSHAAFPIVVSDADPYPGQGLVDDTQTVHSDWKLQDYYAITAVSEDETKGSVTVNGLTIETSPAEGYIADGCTVSPAGAATVKQDGSRFLISDLIQDCQITVHFTPRTVGTITFQTPDGVAQPECNGYIGDSILLPEPTALPQAHDVQYAFAGWAEAPVSGAEKKAAVFQAGAAYPVTSEAQQLYAVYTYYGDGAADPCRFTRVTGALTEQSGTYVLASGGYVARCDGSFLSRSRSGVIFDQNRIARIPPNSTWKISRISGSDCYVIRLGGMDGTAYLASQIEEGTLTTTANFSREEARWRIQAINGGVTISNVKYPERTLQCAVGEDGLYLSCQSGAGKPLTLYQGPSGARLYYTGACANGGGLTAELAAAEELTFDRDAENYGTVTLHNPGTLEKTAQLILVEYDAQGRQISMRVLQSADVASGTDVTLNMEAGDFSADAETAALLVLERGTYQPLCTALTLTRRGSEGASQ